MKELQVYTHRFQMSEVTDMSCFYPFEVKQHEIRIPQLEEIEIDKPTLYIVRLAPMHEKGEVYQEWAKENCETLWNFIGKLRSWNKNVAVLLIIQQKSFEILYQAMTAHIDEVIVEPENEKELIGKILNCTKRIQKVEKLIGDQRKLEEYEFDRRQATMTRIMESIIEKPNEVEFLIPEINKRYGLHLGEQNYQAVVIEVDQFEFYNKDSSFLKDVSLLIMHQITLAQEIMVGEIDPYGLVAVINYPKSYNINRKHEQYEELRLAVSHLQRTYGEFHFSIGVGPMVEKVHEIENSINQAVLAQEFRVNSPEQVHYASKYPNIIKKVNGFLSERTIRELCRYMALGDAEHIRQWFADFYENIEPRFESYPPAYVWFCWKIYQVVTEMEKASKIRKFPDMKFFALQHTFDGHERMKGIELLLLEISLMMQSEVSSEHEIALHAIAYMKVHYAEAINLEVLAENSGLSTSYFSRKFKEQTGENYIDVLTEIRMKEAERLLRETELPIEDIIVETGYFDDKHFRKLFYRQTGMTPSEYRKKGKGKG